jgi:hypothetical protein
MGSVTIGGLGKANAGDVITDMAQTSKSFIQR